MLQRETHNSKLVGLDAVQTTSPHPSTFLPASPASMTCNDNIRDAHGKRKTKVLEIRVDDMDAKSDFSEEDISVAKRLEYSKAAKLAQKVEKVINTWIVQLFYMALTLMYCWKYAMDELSHREKSHNQRNICELRHPDCHRLPPCSLNIC